MNCNGHTHVFYEFCVLCIHAMDLHSIALHFFLQDFIFEIVYMFDKTACVKVVSILLLAHQL